MKHRIAGRKFNRTASHRKAMLANMATSLLKHERIKTTLAKAKELRGYIEPIITRAKVNSLHNKREILKKIKDRRILVKLFENISLRYLNRPGGYTRIIRFSQGRAGDNSKMALIELVEESLEPASSAPDKKKKKSKLKKEETKAEETSSEEAEKLETKTSETEAVEKTTTEQTEPKDSKEEKKE